MTISKFLNNPANTPAILTVLSVAAMIGAFWLGSAGLSQTAAVYIVGALLGRLIIATRPPRMTRLRLVSAALAWAAFAVWLGMEAITGFSGN